MLIASKYRSRIKHSSVHTKTLDNSFIHTGYLYSAPSRNLLRGALIPATAKEKCLKMLAERRHVVPGQQAQCKREFFQRGGPIAEKARHCLSENESMEEYLIKHSKLAFHCKSIKIKKIPLSSWNYQKVHHKYFDFNTEGRLS